MDLSFEIKAGFSLEHRVEMTDGEFRNG